MFSKVQWDDDDDGDCGDGSIEHWSEVKPMRSNIVFVVGGRNSCVSPLDCY